MDFKTNCGPIFESEQNSEKTFGILLNEKVIYNESLS